MRHVHPAYFETRFRTPASITSWPDEFVIVTAYATTGEAWPAEENERAGRCLDQELRGELRVAWCQRITGYSPTSGHAEPGWAVELPFDDACELGTDFLQDAIYWVRGDELSVSYCDHRRGLVRVGSFRERLDPAGG